MEAQYNQYASKVPSSFFGQTTNLMTHSHSVCKVRRTLCFNPNGPVVCDLPSLLAFDAPTREECTVNRTLSNTPLQALVLLNSPIYTEAARVFAQNARESGQTTFDQQLTWIFDRALNRAPTGEERKILKDLYRTNLIRFRASPVDAGQFVKTGEAPLDPAKNQIRNLPQLAAMTIVTRAVLNLHETITRN